MAIDHRQALIRLIAALELHFEAALDCDGEWYTPELEDAEQRLRDAFFTYDDVLFTELGVELPFDILDIDDDDDEDDEDYDEESDEDEDDEDAKVDYVNDLLDYDDEIEDFNLRD